MENDVFRRWLARVGRWLQIMNIFTMIVVLVVMVDTGFSGGLAFAFVLLGVGFWIVTRARRRILVADE